MMLPQAQREVLCMERNKNSELNWWPWISTEFCFTYPQGQEISFESI